MYSSGCIQAELLEKSSIDYFEMSKYLKKIGTLTVLTLSVCAIDDEHSHAKYHYSESVKKTLENGRIGNENFSINFPLLEEVDADNEIAYAGTKMENMSPVQPHKVIRVKGRVNNVSRGTVSKV